jgi:hypothetical protein
MNVDFIREVFVMKMFLHIYCVMYASMWKSRWANHIAWSVFIEARTERHG